MKTLYLHCGIHKTGSSFLQTLFTRNRELLKVRNIHYPVSQSEYDMLEGNISHGNGLKLSNSLAGDDFQRELRLLDGLSVESKRHGCESVLLSSESLFHEFGKEGAINRLQKAASEAGFGQINALVYFRDPVSHALSTYKHRAKRGDHKDFELWMTTGYETMELLEKFEKYSSGTDIVWNCRKYSKDSVDMAETSFTDWLGLPLPEIPVDDRVNQSLSLSEIRILQMIKEIDQDIVPVLQKKFYVLPREQKRYSKYLEEVYSGIASKKLKEYRPLLKALNRHLPIDETLIVTEEPSHSKRSLNDCVEVDSRQMELVVDSVRDLVRSKAISFKIIELFNSGVIKIKRRFKATGLEV